MKQSAVAVGMFDGVHRGHQALVGELKQCALTRGLIPCVITFTGHPMRHIDPMKAPKLLTSCTQKTAYLHEAGAEKVLTLDFNDALRRLTAKEFMSDISGRLNAKVWMLGFNHRFGSDRLSDFGEFERIGRDMGIEVLLARREVIDGMLDPVSSSLIRESLQQGRVEEANLMLGREYSIRGSVEQGRQIGRTIGFPTANVRPVMEEQLIPKKGAYACEAVIEGVCWPAMTNIGCRPTIGSNLASTIETHVIGFDGNLYGTGIEVRFRRRLRDERKFASLADLRAQLTKDLADCLADA